MLGMLCSRIWSATASYQQLPSDLVGGLSTKPSDFITDWTESVVGMLSLTDRKDSVVGTRTLSLTDPTDSVVWTRTLSLTDWKDSVVGTRTLSFLERLFLLLLS